MIIGSNKHMKFEKKELLKVLGNTCSLLIVRFSGTLTTFVITLLIVSFMGVSSLGSFVKITSFVALFYLLIDFGLNTTYLKDHFHKTEVFFGNLLLLRLLLSFGVFALVLLITFLLPTGVASGFTLIEKVGIMAYSLTLFTEGILISFSGLTQKALLQKTLIFPSIISSLVVLALVSYGVVSENILFILLAFPLGEVVQIFLLFLYVKKSILFSIYPVSFYSFSKTALLASVPLALMLFLNVVYFRVDTLILSFYKSNADVGSYGFAYKIFEFLLTLPTFLSASIFPLLLVHRENKKEFQKRVYSYGSLLFVSAVLLSVIVYICAPFITLIRVDLSSAVLPLRVLSFALPFFFLTSLLQWVLLLKNKVKFLIGTYLATMIINIALNMVFIPQFSYNAAAAITVITEGLVFLCMTFLFIGMTVRNSSKPNDN